MPNITRSIVSNPFDAESTDAFIREDHDTGHVVHYPFPLPRITLSVDKTMILADNTDAATFTAAFESCALVDNELVWTPGTPTGDVTFTVNLRPTTVAINADGRAVLVFSTNSARVYRVYATCDGYGSAHAVVEAV